MKTTGINLCMFIPNNVMKYIASKVCLDYTEEDYEENSEKYNNNVSVIFRLKNDSNFELFKVFNTGYVDYESPAIKSEDSPGALMLSTNALNIFCGAYPTMAEVISEFSDKISDFLPEDFVIRDNIFISRLWSDDEENTDEEEPIDENPPIEEDGNDDNPPISDDDNEVDIPESNEEEGLPNEDT